MHRAMTTNVPIGTAQKYVACKRFTLNGTVLTPGDEVPLDLLSDQKLEQLARQRFIEARMNESPREGKASKKTAQDTSKPVMDVYAMDRPQLVAFCKSKNIPYSGTADVLRKRIFAAKLA